MGKKIILGVVVLAVVLVGWKMYTSQKTTGSASDSASETQNAAKTSVQVLPAGSAQAGK